MSEENCFSSQNYELMVSTTLMIVIITTLVFGTFMAVVQKLWVPAKPIAGEAQSQQEHGHDVLN